VDPGRGGAAAIATGLFVNRPGLLGRIGEFTGFLAGLFGAALSGYTGVLVSNTAIPLWQQARRWVPVMFVASSATAAASVLDVIAGDGPGRPLVRIFGTAGRVVELAASQMVERAASEIPKVAEPLRRGGSAVWWRTAGVLTATSLLVSLFPGRQRRIGAGILGIAGSLCLRFAVHYAGNASARDPRASFHQQRRSVGQVA
jgi:formate-dependent nitrite reductase membrane component NrfD